MKERALEGTKRQVHISSNITLQQRLLDQLRANQEESSSKKLSGKCFPLRRYVHTCSCIYVFAHAREKK